MASEEEYMTFDEKVALSKVVEKLPGKEHPNIYRIVLESDPNALEECDDPNWVLVDFAVLKPSTLKELEGYISSREVNTPLKGYAEIVLIIITGVISFFIFKYHLHLKADEKKENNVVTYTEKQFIRRSVERLCKAASRTHPMSLYNIKLILNGKKPHLGDSEELQIILKDLIKRGKINKIRRSFYCANDVEAPTTNIEEEISSNNIEPGNNMDTEDGTYERQLPQSSTGDRQNEFTQESYPIQVLIQSMDYLSLENHG